MPLLKRLAFVMEEYEEKELKDFLLRHAKTLVTVDLDTPEQQEYQNSRLALLLELAHTRSGAKCIIYYNLFRSLEDSGLFEADPDLQINNTNSRALE
ncbi:Nucleoporin [Fusarium oxysporum f. sp. vasinfectum]|nr:Nucleoporin [Fusarium oxysporum f. sp. vasinfectum]